MELIDKDSALKATISVLPESPGVYQYFDKEGKIIYVGKAKNLKRRVSSYFNKIHDSVKTNVLVRNIVEIKYIVVNTEEDALHLENSLIKELKPRYNVLLKDDKTYPWICVPNEHFPRVFLTRRITKDGSQYFGPYTNVHGIKAILELIKNLYPIRTCKFNLTPDNIKAKKFKVCLQYHIKNCKGPCEGKQTEDDYLQYIHEIKQILKGNTQQLSKQLFTKMQALAAELRFEEAQSEKEKYELIENYRAKSLVVSPSLSNLDVYSFDEDESSAYINYLNIYNGAIISAYTIEYRKRIDEPKEELLALGIMELRDRFKSENREIIVPFMPEMSLNNINFTIPQKGEKRKLLELSEQNVKQYKLDKLKKSEKLNPEQRMVRILNTLKKDLGLKELPLQIECFDNSNIQGTNPVAACVVFKNAKPAKKDYRHFNIKTVVGPDDFASMREIVHRRYSRLLEENAPLPQLIVIDGGKGQLNAACESLSELKLLGKIPIIGIAKRLEEIFFPDDPIPLYLDKNSESLKLIQRLRDEAHRFGITHHRNKRSKTQIVSKLDEIKGIGRKTKEELLLKYKSVKRLSEGSFEELVSMIGESKAKKIIEGLKDLKKTE